MNPNVTTVTKATMADMIAAIWYGLGFKPRESLVLAGLEGPRNRLGITLRIDLPGVEVSRSRQRKMIRGCLTPILDAKSDTMLALVMSATALTDPPPRIASLLAQEARGERLPVLDVIGVTSTGYRSLRCRDDECCPRAGNPIEAVQSSQAAAVHVLNGDTVVDSERDLIADVLPEGRPGAVAGGADSAFWSRPPLERLSSAERLRWWRVWTSARQAAAGGVVDPAALRGLSGALFDPDLRDALLMDLLGAPQPQLAAVLDGGSRVALLGDGGRQPHLATLLSTSPDRERLATGEMLIAAAARVAPAGDRAPALAVLAMLAWYQGNGGRSRLLVQRAHDDHPSLSLTQLVDDLLVTLTRPPWMKNW